MRVLLASAVLVLAAAVPAGAQSGLVVHANLIIPNPPPTAPIADWKSATGRATMEVASDGTLLRGYRYTGADANAPVIVFFNGNAGSLNPNELLYRQIAALGPSVVVLDYRGYGFSGGTADVTAFQQDGVRIFDAVTLANPNQRVVVYGFSMGTAVASYVAANRPVAGLILVAAFSSAREEFPVMAKRNGMSDDAIASVTYAPDALADFDEAGFVARSQAPLLVIHGTADVTVPIALGRRVFAASAATRKNFVEVPGSGHNETVGTPAAMDAVRAFAASLRP